MSAVKLAKIRRRFEVREPKGIAAEGRHEKCTGNPQGRAGAKACQSETSES